MKKCPKCGMVHAETDFVCRRCRVDLLTGEPAAVSLPSQSGGSSAAAEVLAGLAPKILSRVSGAFSKVQKKAVSLVPKRFTGAKTAAGGFHAGLVSVAYQAPGMNREPTAAAAKHNTSQLTKPNALFPELIIPLVLRRHREA